MDGDGRDGMEMGWIKVGWIFLCLKKVEGFFDI